MPQQGQQQIHTAVNLLPVNTCATDDAARNRSTARSAATCSADSGQQPAQQPSPQQGSVQQADRTPQGPAPVQQQDDPKVKPGSEADVSAIGNRNVGHGLNFYSLEA